MVVGLDDTWAFKWFTHPCWLHIDSGTAAVADEALFIFIPPTNEVGGGGGGGGGYTGITFSVCLSVCLSVRL